MCENKMSAQCIPYTFIFAYKVGKLTPVVLTFHILFSFRGIVHMGYYPFWFYL